MTPKRQRQAWCLVRVAFLLLLLSSLTYIPAPASASPYSKLPEVSTTQASKGLDDHEIPTVDLTDHIRQDTERRVRVLLVPGLWSRTLQTL
jgi:hypothetical protein